jgi:hypothetical protein
LFARCGIQLQEKQKKTTKKGKLAGVNPQLSYSLVVSNAP